MGWLRLGAVMGGLIAWGLVGVLYAEVGTRLINLGGSGGTHEGFLSSTIDQVGAVVPVLIAVVVLAIMVWFIVGTAQEERTVRRGPPR